MTWFGCGMAVCEMVGCRLLGCVQVFMFGTPMNFSDSLYLPLLSHAAYEYACM